ncbi:MAG: hydantoinase B/oxoprolinase family protein, partial [Verrucomicrobiota bacterium]
AELVMNAPHIPVHLGAMGVCARRVLAVLPLEPGDVAVLNHPAAGGSHLPDVTLLMPVFAGDEETLLGYVANRAHHAEIGGTVPGSMPAGASTLAEEGVVIAPRKLVAAGEARWEEMRGLLSSGPHPSRRPEENLADLHAQLASLNRGAELLRAMAAAAGAEAVTAQMGRLLEATAQAAVDALRAHLGDRRTATVTETIDDGTPVCVAFEGRGEGRWRLDFAGTGGGALAHPGNFNATEAVVRSAVMYALRLLVGGGFELNEGLMRPVEVALPECFLHPRFDLENPARCPAVVAGNVETSQRVVDALLRALGLAACSQGTMNNLIFGNERCSYYETIGGGAGATAESPGASALHTHMTNTAITDPEVLERRYPVRLERFGHRAGSGGAGRHGGGEGIVRELVFLEPMEVNLLTQHRVEAPYGLEGGQPGATGRQTLVRATGEAVPLEGCADVKVRAGDRLIIETPGGGGYGYPPADSG